MADRELRFIIKAQDDASKAIKGVNKSLQDMGAQAAVSSRMVAGASGLLNREIGRSFQSFGSSVLRGIGSLTDAARESEQVGKSLDAVLKSTQGAAGLTRKELDKLANSLAAVTNFEDDTIARGEHMLLTFTKIGKEVFPEATETMLNMATAMKTDVQGAAIQLGKALNNPLEGLSALTRVGVTFNDEQKLMIERMMVAGNIAGAQRVILDELGREFGGLAKETADAGIQMRNSINEVKEDLGKSLKPALDEIAVSLIPILASVRQWIVDNPELTKTVLLVVAAVGALAFGLGSLVVVLGTVSAALGVIGVSLAAGGAVFVALSGIVALLVVVTQHWEGLKWMATEAITSITDAVSAFAISVGEKFGIAESAIKSFLKLLREAAAAAASASLNVLTGGASGAVNVVRGVVGRANGGYVNESITRVGENGPELVSLPRGSYVHTAEKSRAMLGGFTGPLVGQVVVQNDADENRLVEKLARMIQLQTLAA